MATGPTSGLGAPLQLSIWAVVSWVRLNGDLAETQRLFLAAGVPAPEVQRIRSFRLPHLEGARWVSPENLHITLCFLGRVAAPRVAGLSEAFCSAASQIPADDVAVEGFGGFPRRSRATVLWAGLADRSEVLGSLADSFSAAALRLGLPLDERPFHAHLTLARFKKGVDLRGIPHLPAGAPWRVDEVHLFSSKPGDGAPVYERMATYPLASKL